MDYACFNGKIIPADEPVLLASNRGYRYGDGLFETIKMSNGKLLLEDFHFERLFTGFSLLGFEQPAHFTKEKIREEIVSLCKKNKCEGLGRVRLSVSRGNGGLYDGETKLQYLIESWPLNGSVYQLNENGLHIGVYPGGRKSQDMFSQLKTASFLLYSMAARFAKIQQWNDCLVLNSANQVADATIANVFLIKNKTIITPGLGEACVAGVMRRHLLQHLVDFDVREQAIAVTDLQEADEIFLSNAIHGIRWVGRFGEKTYSNTITREIFDRFVKTILT